VMTEPPCAALSGLSAMVTLNRLQMQGDSRKTKRTLREPASARSFLPNGCTIALEANDDL